MRVTKPIVDSRAQERSDEQPERIHQAVRIVDLIINHVQQMVVLPFFSIHSQLQSVNQLWNDWDVASNVKNTLKQDSCCDDVGVVGEVQPFGRPDQEATDAET